MMDLNALDISNALLKNVINSLIAKGLSMEEIAKLFVSEYVSFDMALRSVLVYTIEGFQEAKKEAR